MQYIGESEHTLAVRFGQHKGYLRRREFHKGTGSHFNQRGHCLSDMQVAVVEKIHSPNPVYRKEREKYLIRKFNSYYSGLNRAPE